MSLVNDMLRDLDRRRGRDVPEGVRILSEDHDERAGRQRALLIGAMVLAVLACLAVAGWLLLGRDDYREQVVDSTPVAAQGVLQEAETADDEEVGDAGGESVQTPRLDLVSVRELTDSLSLELSFTGGFRHRITNINSAQLALVIDDVRLTEGFRPPELAGSGEVQIIQTGEGVELKLNTDRAAEFDIQALSGNRLNITVDYRDADGGGRESTDVASSPETEEAREASPRGPDEDSETTQDNTESTAEPVRTTRELSLEERDAETREEGLGLARRGEIVDAYRLLRDFVASNPAAHRSRETLVALLLTQQDPVQAEAVLNEGLALAPSHPAFRRLQARLRIVAGEPEEALSLLETSPPALEEDVAYHDLMASLLQQLERHERAIAVFQDLLRHRPREGRWWVAMGISLEALERFEEARGSYQSALGMQGLGEALRQYSQNRLEVLRRR